MLKVSSSDFPFALSIIGEKAASRSVDSLRTGKNAEVKSARFSVFVVVIGVRGAAADSDRGWANE
jgi:hypothetical protein